MSQPSNPIANIWRWDGTVDRKTYALVGIIGFAVKNNLDRYVARSSYFFNYWAPLGKATRLGTLSRAEINFLLTLLILSLPFIWVGVAMTVRRLRDAAQPLWLTCLFFVPFVNLIFFLVLCVLSSNDRPMSSEAPPWPNVPPLDHLIPRGKLASTLLSTGVTAVIGLFFLLLGTQLIGSYG